MYELIQTGVSAPKGFHAAGMHCGIKKQKKDLSLILSLYPATGAGVFTTNKVPAAPVLIDREALSSSASSLRAILVNSGNANACTGERGAEDAQRMIRAAASALSIRCDQVLISSTGVIGQFLPIERIEGAMPELCSLLDVAGHSSAAEGIMTTDTFSKECAVRFQAGDFTFTIGGMAKGSGMIAPNMATMLAFVTTDAAISPSLLRHALQRAADRSFNRISVDGNTSTNDMILALANGCAGNPVMMSADDPIYHEFYEALEYVLIRLSKMIVLDGEGATKFVEINVTSAQTEDAALRAARAIANSNLVKTAIHGEDANWGRILAAVGCAGIDFNPADVEISFGSVPILRRGYVIDFSEQAARDVLTQKEITITVDLHQGNASALFWTCDLSKDYITINSNYRT